MSVESVLGWLGPTPALYMVFGVWLISLVLSALIGVLCSAFLRKGDHEKQHQILLREKFEEMTMHFLDSVGWLRQMFSACSEIEIMDLSYDQPGRKALALCHLYFPEIADTVIVYQDAQLEFYNFVANAYDKESPEPAGLQAMHSDMEAWKSLLEYFDKTKGALEHLITAMAKDYSKA